MNWSDYWHILAAVGASFGVSGFSWAFRLASRISRLNDQVRELERRA
jgi:hypothetical protein